MVERNEIAHNQRRTRAIDHASDVVGSIMKDHAPGPDPFCNECKLGRRYGVWAGLGLEWPGLDWPNEPIVPGGYISPAPRAEGTIGEQYAKVSRAGRKLTITLPSIRFILLMIWRLTVSMAALIGSVYAFRIANHFDQIVAGNPRPGLGPVTGVVLGFLAGWILIAIALDVPFGITRDHLSRWTTALTGLGYMVPLILLAMYVVVVIVLGAIGLLVFIADALNGALP